MNVSRRSDGIVLGIRSHERFMMSLRCCVGFGEILVKWGFAKISSSMGGSREESVTRGQNPKLYETGKTVAGVCGNALSLSS